jgi:hypothetical protein
MSENGWNADKPKERRIIRREKTNFMQFQALRFLIYENRKAV